MHLSRIFQKNSPPPISNGITCSLEELLELRHTTRPFWVSGGRQAHSLFAGNTRSRFRGRGMDYEESRIYTPGDDIRNLDWRVTARSGKVHCKLFTEERDRPVINLVDFSPSLYFGTKNAFKSVVAARLAATVAWSAVLNHDRIGGLIQTPETSFDLRPRPGRKGVLALIHALVKASRPPDQAGTFVLETILHQAQQSIRPGSRVFLISDFYGLNASCERSLSQLRRHNDLVLCQVIDPLEMSPPAAGFYSISDGNRQAVLDTGSAAVRHDYQMTFARRREKLMRLAANLRSPVLQIVSDDDLTASLRRGLQPGSGNKKS